MSINLRRTFHLTLFAVTFQIVTIWMSGGHILPSYKPSCDPMILCTCEP